jgi:2-dehydropantoate 2-reductase
MGMGEPDLLILGTGAMACLFAARLSAAGVKVKMLGTWAAGLTALSQQGVRVVELNGEERVYPVQATSDPSAWAGASRALVLVKAWQTEQSAQQLLKCLHPDGLVLTLQNGDGNYEKLCHVLGVRRVALGATTLGATLLGPGKVRPAGEGVITLGIHAQLKPISEMLGKAGFVVETVTDIQSVQWGKMVINTAINPLTAILRVPNGALLTKPNARAVMASAAREAAAVAVAKGVQLPYPDPVVAVETIARRTSANYSSMLQDILRGAPTEVDFITGAIVRVGEITGVATQVNRTLWRLVKAIGENQGS